MLFMHQMPLDDFFQKLETFVYMSEKNMEKNIKIQKTPDDEHDATAQMDSKVPDGLAAIAEW